MYSEFGITVFGLVILIWILTVTVFLFREHKFLNKLFPKSGERDIRKKFEEVIQAVSRSNLEIKNLNDK